MNAEHEHVTVNLPPPPPPPPYYTHSTADTWHPTLVPKNSGLENGDWSCCGGYLELHYVYKMIILSTAICDLIVPVNVF